MLPSAGKPGASREALAFFEEDGSLDGSYRNTAFRNWKDYKMFLSATEYHTLGIIPSEYKNVVFSPVILVGIWLFFFFKL